MWTQAQIDTLTLVYARHDPFSAGAVSPHMLERMVSEAAVLPELSRTDLMDLVMEANVSGGGISFAEFLRLMDFQREKARPPPEADLLMAFVACGGGADKSGCVARDDLVNIIKRDFSLQIDIDALIDSVDDDGSGEIEWEEFVELLQGGSSGGGGGDGDLPLSPAAGADGDGN